MNDWESRGNGTCTVCGHELDQCHCEEPVQVRRDELLEWAIRRWQKEVMGRPLENVNRRALDDTWRQVIRRLGGNAEVLCGPPHDELLRAEKPKEQPPVTSWLGGTMVDLDILDE